MVALALVPRPLSQLYVPPPVAVTVVDVVVQLSAPPPVMPADGVVTSCVIVTDDVEVHPLAPVTVTV